MTLPCATVLEDRLKEARIKRLIRKCFWSWPWGHCSNHTELDNGQYYCCNCPKHWGRTHRR